MNPCPAPGWLLAAACLFLTPLRAADPAPPPPGGSTMTTYYFCLLTKGPNREQPAAEAQRLQTGHMANMNRLAEAGKLLVAGPFADDGEWRGIFILKCASLAEAQTLVATDPAVAAGRLLAEVHPWMTAKGYIRDPEFPQATFAPLAP